MTSETKKIMLAGVGGQGILLAARILAEGLIRAGYDVKASEVHGMAQRGGSVVTQLCYGDRVYSPLHGAGVFDLLVSLEKMEGLRYVHFLKKGGILLLNEKEIPSLPVFTGAMEYPRDIVDRLAAFPIRLHVVDADARAAALGNMRVSNVILLGAILKLTGLEDLLDWQEIVAQFVKRQFAAVNIKALAAGLQLV